MIMCPVLNKDPDAHLLFPAIRNKNIPISIGEIIGVRLIEGKNIIGIVDEISENKIHIWIRSEVDPNSRRQRINLTIDQIIKLS